MNNWILDAAIMIAVGAIVGIMYERRKVSRVFAFLEQMLQAAKRGDFSEEHFDESQLSKIETEFYQYLSTSEVSAKATIREKEKIKTLISDISHQTKTPIANLLLYSDLLRETPLTDDQKESIEAIHKQAEKLRSLIEDLVKLSRLENGTIQPSPKDGNVSHLLQSVYEEMMPKALQKGIDLQVQISKATAVFDEKWTQEALSNIVDNAIKYTDKGRVSITNVEYEMFVRIDVTDTGIGIAEEDQAKIFGRFYRSEAVRNSDGVGIGLYLAREIISVQGGYIRVQSVAGRGSVFSLFLPKS